MTFFFLGELCRLDLPRFVFLCTNLEFPIGSRRLSGSHHITVCWKQNAFLCRLTPSEHSPEPSWGKIAATCSFFLLEMHLCLFQLERGSWSGQR